MPPPPALHPYVVYQWRSAGSLAGTEGAADNTDAGSEGAAAAPSHNTGAVGSEGAAASSHSAAAAAAAVSGSEGAAKGAAAFSHGAGGHTDALDVALKRGAYYQRPRRKRERERERERDHAQDERMRFVKEHRLPTNGLLRTASAISRSSIHNPRHFLFEFPISDPI